MTPAPARRELRLASVARISLVLLLASSAGSRAGGEPLPADPEHAAYRDCAPPTAERLAFLQTRLEENASYARWWWRGWTGVYVGGMAYEGVQAGLEDDRGERANHIASAVKATIGLARALLAPPEAREGAVARDTRGCAETLQLAERRLRRSAEEARDERWGWIPHLANLGLNAAAAIVVAEMYDEDEAYWSGALGFAVGEIRLWTFPWQAEDDWETYRRRYDLAARPPVSWQLAPTHDGVALVVRF